ncbi:MAG: G1 family glutamic endopeptidase [Acidimicrobiales bacterium]
MPHLVAAAQDSWQSTESATSPNWSGYVAEAHRPFTAVKGAWVQPALACSGSAGAAAFWVGLDGFRDATVEQIGVKAICAAGGAIYRGWWQLWPGPVHFLSLAYPVRPTDVMHASVTRSGSIFTLSLRSSAGWSYSTARRASADSSSAEWIASDPPACRTCGYVRLANFDTVTFSRSRAADGKAMKSIGSFRRADRLVSVTMVAQGGAVLARPGPAGAGSSFAVTWEGS